LRVCKTIAYSRYRLTLLRTSFHRVPSNIASTTSRLEDRRSRPQHNLHFLPTTNLNPSLLYNFSSFFHSPQQFRFNIIILYYPTSRVLYPLDTLSLSSRTRQYCLRRLEARQQQHFTFTTRVLVHITQHENQSLHFSFHSTCFLLPLPTFLTTHCNTSQHPIPRCSHQPSRIASTRLPVTQSYSTSPPSTPNKADTQLECHNKKQPLQPRLSHNATIKPQRCL
jgi:hypothetical protein